MNKLTRITSLSAAGVLLASTLTGCSAYNNPDKYIKVPDKGAITLKQSEIDKKYAEELEEILESYRETEYTELTAKDEVVKDGDKVNIDYTGSSGEDALTLTEDQLSHMKDEGFDLVIGSDTFIKEYDGKNTNKKNKGFEDQIIGHKVGETFTVTVTFPDSYSSDTALEGMIVKFEVKLNKISRASVHDDSTVTIEYTFADSEDKKEEDKKEEDTENKEKSSATATTEAPKTTEAPDTTEAPATSDKEDDKEDDTKKLSDKFKDGDFEIDYTEEIDKDEKFNDLFKVSDYADEFKDKVWGHEYTFVYTVPEDVDSAYKDYIGRKIDVTLKLTDITHLPEWTDEKVSEHTDKEYTTVDSYAEYMKNNVRANLVYEKVLAETSVLSYPKSERNQIYKNYVNQLVYQKVGADPSTKTQKELDEVLTDEVYQSIYTQAASQTLTALKERLVLEKLLDIYDIKLTSKEYKTQLTEAYTPNATYYAMYMGISDEKAFERYYGKESLELQFKSNKLMEVIGDYATVESDS